MDLGLQGKVALVSGGSEGVGRAIAGALAAEGVLVGVAARRPEPLALAVKEIEAAGGSATAIEADMASLAGIEAAVAATTDHFGRAPDIAVANVHGAEAWLHADEVSDEQVLEACNDFLLNIVRLVRLVTPAMKERQFGRILNVGSDCVKELHREVLMPLANTIRPAASGYLKTASTDLGRYGITLNTLGIGAVGTPRRRTFFERTAAERGLDVDATLAAQVAHIPVGRFGYPEEVGALGAFLCSVHAGFITGETLMVDGGRTRTII
jgi:3-oxoacyl-[acyl-carrier protein] reductase